MKTEQYIMLDGAYGDMMDSLRKIIVTMIENKMQHESEFIKGEFDELKTARLKLLAEFKFKMSENSDEDDEDERY